MLNINGYIDMTQSKLKLIYDNDISLLYTVKIPRNSVV